MNDSASNSVDLTTLLALFDLSDELANFAHVAADELPPVYHNLLAHEHHMTVTVEAHHGCLVDVEVLAKHVTKTHYARKILLRRQSDGTVVQFGIMRVRLDVFRPAVRDAILAAKIPLGRILIEHDVFRDIQLCQLWRVTPGAALIKCFEIDESQVTYGRTALIVCNREPAIELLEIVRPES